MPRKSLIGNLAAAPLLAVLLAVATSPARAEYFLTPDSPTALAGTVWDPFDIVRNDAGTFTLEMALPAGTAVDATHRRDAGDWLISVSEPAPLGGVFYDPRDIVRYDGSTFTLLFNGAAAGIPAVANVDAVFLQGGDAGDLILSFDVPVTIGGAAYEPADLVRYHAGAFSLYFDASAATPPIPPSANLVEADERGGKLLLSFDVPTKLGSTTFMPGQVVSWSGSAFAVRFQVAGWPAASAMTGLSLGNCLDDDGDHFGSPGDPRCTGGASTDCADGAPSVYPGAAQACGDGLNNDCSSPTWPSLAGTNEADDDGDHYSQCTGDCDDTRSPVYPGAAQICGDGLNNDCSSPSWPSLAATNEADDDGDLLPECAGDCNDADATAIAPPSMISGVDVASVPGGNRYSWIDQSAAAGVGTVYDVFWGSVGGLGPTGNFSTGSCRAENVATAFFDDQGVIPPPRSAYYFMMRAQNSCATSSWGTSNRDATAAASSSPCQ